jgi:hypothetical protein
MRHLAVVYLNVTGWLDRDAHERRRGATVPSATARTLPSSKESVAVR